MYHLFITYDFSQIVQQINNTIISNLKFYAFSFLLKKSFDSV